MPEDARARDLLNMRDGSEAVVKARGVAGGLLVWVATRLGQFEQRLVLQGGGGRLNAGLQHLGNWLKWVESLLQQPRYLLLMVMATLVVIL
jgi:hypothetical protein